MRHIPYNPRPLDELRARVDYYARRAAEAVAELKDAEAGNIRVALGEFPADVLRIIQGNAGSTSALRLACKRFASIMQHDRLYLTRRSLPADVAWVARGAVVVISNTVPVCADILEAIAPRKVIVRELGFAAARSPGRLVAVANVELENETHWASCSDILDPAAITRLKLAGIEQISHKRFPNLRQVKLTCAFVGIMRAQVYRPTIMYSQLQVDANTFRDIIRYSNPIGIDFTVTSEIRGDDFYDCRNVKNCRVRYDPSVPYRFHKFQPGPDGWHMLDKS